MPIVTDTGFGPDDLNARFVLRRMRCPRTARWPWM